MRKILIIEDDKRIAQALEIRVKNAGYETAVVHDALAGVMRATQFQPDALLVDINLPAGNGFMVVERIQANSTTKKIPAIFITASKMPGLVDRAIASGASGFIEKPYSPEKLLELLKNVLNKPAPTIATATSSAAVAPAYRN